MSTLADKVHDSFDAYYAGKNTGWCAPRAAPQDAAWRKKAKTQQKQAETEDTPPESRH